MSETEAEGASAADTPRSCAKEECSNVEQQPGAFVLCPRCRGAAYCSRECQRDDYCTGHSACALEGLQQAAAKPGGFGKSSCLQATKLMTANVASPLLLPSFRTAKTGLQNYYSSHGHTLAALSCGPLPDEHVTLQACMLSFTIIELGAATPTFASLRPGEYPTPPTTSRPPASPQLSSC